MVPGLGTKYSPEAGLKHREVRAAPSAQSEVSVHATLRQIKPASYPPADQLAPLSTPLALGCLSGPPSARR